MLRLQVWKSTMEQSLWKRTDHDCPPPADCTLPAGWILGPEPARAPAQSRPPGCGGGCLSRQCAGAFGRVPGGRVVEAKYSECLRNEEIIFGAGFSTENRRNQSIIRRKLVLIRTTLIFV